MRKDARLISSAERTFYLEKGVRYAIEDRLTLAILQTLLGKPRESRELLASSADGGAYRLVQDDYGARWALAAGMKHLVLGLSEAGTYGAMEQPALEAVPAAPSLVRMTDLESLRCELIPLPAHTEAQESGRTLQEYLCAAMCEPRLLKRPFSAANREILKAMEQHRADLNKRYAKIPQDRLVSVIMPTFDRAAIIGRAIRAVINQTYRNWELLIIDDGGSDNTSEVVAAFNDPRIRFYRRETNGGHAVARNDVLRHASGYYVACADSDDYWEPDFLLLIVGKLLESPAFRSAYCAQKIWSSADPETGAGKGLTGVMFAPFNRSLLENSNYINQNSFVHERSMLDEFGGYDSSLRRLVDYEFYLRLTEQHFPFALPAALSNYFPGAALNRVSNVEAIETPRTYIHTKVVSRAPLAPYFRDKPIDLLDHIYGTNLTPPKTNYARPVTVLIISYQYPDHLRACIEALKHFSPADIKLHLLDLGSDASDAYLSSIETSGAIKVSRLAKGSDYSDAFNEGLQAADPGHDLMLLNHDTLVTPGWLEGIRQAIDAVPEAGLIFPRIVVPPRTNAGRSHVPGANHTYEIDITLSARRRNAIDPYLRPELGLVELNYGPFCCVYIRREALSLCGEFDRHNESGQAADWLYCYVVRNLAKQRIIYTPRSKVYYFAVQDQGVWHENEPPL